MKTKTRKSKNISAVAAQKKAFHAVLEQWNGMSEKDRNPEWATKLFGYLLFTMRLPAITV